MAEYTPFPQLNIASTQVTPSGVHTIDDVTTVYYQRMLYERVTSRFEWTVPETWDVQYLNYLLVRLGYAVVLDSDIYAYKPEGRVGVIPQYGTRCGIGVYHQPTQATVASSLINAPNLVLGKDAELIRMTPDYMGIWDIIQTYAELLSMANMAASMSLINSKVAYVMGATDKASAQTLKALYSQIQQGQPGVVYDERYFRKEDKFRQPGDAPWFIWNRDVKSSYVSDLALHDYNTILSMFDAEIGIPTTNNPDKRAQMSVEEVTRNNDANAARLIVWENCLHRSIEKVNSLFAGQLEPIRLSIRKPEEVTTNVI